MVARVLVVDDVMPNVKLLAAKLTREYFDVLTAYNGQEALDLVKLKSPDIILLDVMMPGMDGFEVCQRIRSDPQSSNIPIVMVTALSDVNDRVRGLEAGADDFLTKPVNDTALFARVRSLVRLKMMMDQLRLRETTSEQFGMDRVSMQSESYSDARVLVLEDSHLDLEKITEAIERDGSRVTATTNSVAALEIAQSQDFELVVISLTLLNEDGLRLCSQLRSYEDTRQVPILLIIDEGDMNRVAKGLELGANDYIIKPIDRNELQARVRTQIRRKRYQDRLRTNYEQSLSLALTDPLTGIFNRRYVDAHLPRLLERAVVNKKTLAAVYIDIDHFKQVNDTYGHPAGDRVLKEVVVRVSRNLRNFDLVARHGGEEFLVIMPDTDEGGAVTVSERLRRLICDEPFYVGPFGAGIRVTISLGLAMAGRRYDTPDDLIWRADKALLTAKREGRNRVVIDRHTDQLTKLLNRAYVRDQLVEGEQSPLERRLRSDRQMAILAISLDNLDDCQRNHGTEAGNRLVCLFAERIAAQVPTHMLLHYDEGVFLLILSEFDRAKTSAMADGLLAIVVNEPFQLSAKSSRIVVSASIGGAVSGRPAPSAGTFIDAALNALKETRESKAIEIVESTRIAGDVAAALG